MPSVSPPPPPSVGLGGLFVISLAGLAGVFALLMYALGLSPVELVKAAQRQWQSMKESQLDHAIPAQQVPVQQLPAAVGE